MVRWDTTGELEGADSVDAHQQPSKNDAASQFDDIVEESAKEGQPISTSHTILDAFGSLATCRLATCRLGRTHATVEEAIAC